MLESVSPGAARDVLPLVSASCSGPGRRMVRLMRGASDQMTEIRAGVTPGTRGPRGRTLAGVGSAYPRLATSLGLVPLRIPVSLIVLTGAAWALTLYHAAGTSMPMGTA